MYTASQFLNPSHAQILILILTYCIKTYLSNVKIFTNSNFRPIKSVGKWLKKIGRYQTEELLKSLYS